jgi:rhodanese-related sulfurtransferase
MNRKHLWLLVLFIITVAVLAACDSSDEDNGPSPAATEAGSADPTGEYQTLSIEEFAAIVDERADEYQIINVHIPYAGEVPNTDANVPYNDLDALMAALPDKNAPIVLYCRSGNMSQQASEALIAEGYTQVWDVPGGMNAWQAIDRELVDTSG